MYIYVQYIYINNYKYIYIVNPLYTHFRILMVTIRYSNVAIDDSETSIEDFLATFD